MSSRRFRLRKNKKGLTRYAQVLKLVENVWQPVCGIIKYFQGRFQFRRNRNKDNILRFNPIQIAEWVCQLCEAKLGSPSNKAVTTAKELGISTTRVIQFLNLLRIPVDLRVRLKRISDITEAKLRPIVQMNPAKIRAAVGGMLGLEVLSRVG